MQTVAIAEAGARISCDVVNLGAIPRTEGVCGRRLIDLQQPKEKTMNPTSKTFVAHAASLFAFAFLAMAAPAAHAEDYCITNGAQAAHGCGYPTMETCRAASAGIGGTCSLAAAPAKNPNDALAKQPHSRGELRHQRERAAH